MTVTAAPKTAAPKPEKPAKSKTEKGSSLFIGNPVRKSV